jgi:hypothetical protein
MAIKFGDTLENQNPDYPIVDATGNNIAGLCYVASFTNGNLGSIDNSKRKTGTIVVAEDTGNLYVWGGGDGSGTNFGTAEDSDWIAFEPVPKLAATIDVQLDSGLSFGRFENGDQIVISGTAKNAIEIIRDAVTGFVAPSVDITSSADSYDYSTAQRLNQAYTLEFDVTNNNQNSVSGSNFAISSIDIKKRTGSDSYALVETITATSNSNEYASEFTSMNTAGAPTAVSFTYSDTNTLAANADADDNVDYQIDVFCNDSGGTEVIASGQFGRDTVTDLIVIDNYVAPSSVETITRQSAFSAPAGFVNSSNSSVTFVNTSGQTANVNTVVGDNDWVCVFVVSRQSPLVDISSYTVHRVVDGVESVALVNGSGNVAISGTMSATGGTITLDDAQAASVRENVKWRIKVTDAQGTTSLTSPTVTYMHLGYLGFSAVDNDPTATAIAAGVVTGTTNATLTEAQIEGLSTRKIAASLNDVHLFTGNGSATIALNAPSNQFLYICYPDSSQLLTQFQAVGASSTLDSDVACSEASSNTAFSEAFETSPISVQNVAGLSENYLVYRSVSPSAFDGSKNYSIR